MKTQLMVVLGFLLQLTLKTTGAEEMVQQLRALVVLEDAGLVPSTSV